MKQIEGTPFFVQLDRDVTTINYNGLAQEICQKHESDRFGEGIYLASDEDGYYPLTLIFKDESEREQHKPKQPSPAWINEARRVTEIWARRHLNRLDYMLAH